MPNLRRRATAPVPDAPASPPPRTKAAPPTKQKAAPSGAPIQSRRARRAALCLALVGAALALATTVPRWQAAYARASANVAAARAEALKRMAANLPPLDTPPKRIFTEPTGGPVPADPANPSEAEIKAALGELGQEALPKVPSGASGFVSEWEWENGEAVQEDVLRPRLRAAVLGAFVADAATVGVHGVPGGPAGVAAVLKSARAAGPTFLSPPATPFPVEAGSFSPHGYQVLPLLQSMMARNDLDGEHYVATSIAFFKNTPGHLLPLPSALLAKHATGAKHPDLAIPSDGADGLPKVAPLVARFGGTPHLAGAVATAVGAAQASPAALACAAAAAAVLERVAVLGEGLVEAVTVSAGNPAVPGPGRAWLTAGLDAGRAGQPGLGVADDGDDSAPAALVSAVAAVVVAQAGGQGAGEVGYEAAVTAGATRGGAAAVQRAHLIGAWTAARAAVLAQEAKDPDPARPPGAPPAEWRAKATKALQLEAMAHVLLYQRGAAVPIAMAGDALPEGVEVVAEV